MKGGALYPLGLSLMLLASPSVRPDVFELIWPTYSSTCTKVSSFCRSSNGSRLGHRLFWNSSAIYNRQDRASQEM